MAKGIILLAFLAAFCFLAEGKLSYEHDEKKCAEPHAERRYPFCNWYYLVYAPRIFRAGDKEKVLISTQNVNFDVSVTVKLFSGKKLISSSNDVIKPGVLKELTIKVPLDAPSRGELAVEGNATVAQGTNGILDDATWTFKNRTKSIEIKRSSTQVFIQTDRPIYKPGETVRFRVLSIDDNLKAVKGEVSKVSILNPSRTLMRQWRNVKLSNGFASFKLKLSIKPVLGLWTIKASVNGKQKTVSIKVEKYVLPKFQVSIKPPSYIAMGDTKADGEICAKYSYGKDVNGQLKAKICAEYPRRWDYKLRKYQKAKAVCEDIVKKISGCHPFEIDLQFFKLYQENRYYRSVKFTMEASVKEGATGITLNATKVNMSVEDKNVFLSFDGTPDIFKPGLPFQAWVNAKRPDGQPVDDIEVEVKVRDHKYSNVFAKMIRIQRGKGKINLGQVAFDAKSLKFEARYVRDKMPGSLVQDWKRRSTAYFTSNAWYSPSHSYIAISKDDRIYKPGTTAKFNIMYTTTDDDKISRNVYYTLMSKGNVVLSGSLSAEFTEAKERSRRETAERQHLFNTSSDSVEESDSDELTDSDMADVEMTTKEIPTPEMPTKEATTPEMPAEEATTPEMPTEEATTPEMPTEEATTPEMTTTEAPERLELVTPYHPWWRWDSKPVTRPPKPKKFSVGSFDLEIPITQEMTPSIRMLVYYIKDRETVADSIVIQTGDSFENKVSMKFSDKQVFPGTKVKLTLKATPGSSFAIGAVDKSVHFLRDANDIKAGEVLGLIKQLDVGPGYIREYDRCGSYYWHYSPSSFVDSQKAFNDNGMIFMSNMFIDTRPCYYQRWMRLEVLEVMATHTAIAETTVPPRFHQTQAPFTSGRCPLYRGCLYNNMTDVIFGTDTVVRCWVVSVVKKCPLKEVHDPILYNEASILYEGASSKIRTLFAIFS